MCIFLWKRFIGFIKPPVGFRVTQLVKNSPANAGDARDMGANPGSEKSPREGNGNSLQYSCWENPMDKGAWWANSPWGHQESDTTVLIPRGTAYIPLYSRRVDCLLPFVWGVCVYVCVCTSVSLFRFWFLQVFAEDHWYLMSLFRIHREWTLIWFYFCPLMSRTKTFLITFEIEFLAWGNNADFRFIKMKFSVSSQLWDLGKDVWRSCTSISFYIK